MTTQIRKGVFETNSSSSHSLTMREGDVCAEPFPKEVLRAGVLEVETSEYGWEWYRYYQTYNKIQYLLTQLTGGQTPDGTSEAVTAELREKDARIDMLCRVVNDHTGVALHIMPKGQGYVDHDSVGVGLAVFESEDQLKQMLFSESCFIETGNDNSCAPVSIETDRGGYEDYYCQSYRPVPEGFIPVRLRVKDVWSMSLMTETGKELDSDSALVKAIQAHGVVTQADWFIEGRHNPFDYEDPEARTMSHLGDDDYGLNLHFTEDLKVNVTRVPKEDDACGVLYVALPADIAQQVAEVG